MSASFQLDPREILGVQADASLSQIRDAYREQSRRYHPDLGGQEWAFRLVSRSYEILSAARVASRASEEILRNSPEAAANPFRPVDTRSRPDESDGLRQGRRDHAFAPERRVVVELVYLRFNLEDTLGLLAESPEDRNLSCNLSITWPAAALADRASAIPGASKILDAIAAAFQVVRAETQATSTDQRVADGRFQGWLGFSTAARADAGFRRLHTELNSRGLGVEQWIRDVVIPRDWRRDPS